MHKKWVHASFGTDLIMEMYKLKDQTEMQIITHLVTFQRIAEPEILRQLCQTFDMEHEI